MKILIVFGLLGIAILGLVACGGEPAPQSTPVPPTATATTVPAPAPAPAPTTAPAYDPEGKHVVICGRSNIVGKPIANLLMQRSKGANATVTICHTRTKNLPEITRQADILIAAIGSPRAITADMVKEGAVVIDVGVNRVDAPERKRGYRLVGDVDFDAVSEKAAAITPVPGGVGPMTIAMLLNNTINAARYSIHQDIKH